MNQTSSRRILLLAPHQDDECLQTAGIKPLTPAPM